MESWALTPAPPNNQGRKAVALPITPATQRLRSEGHRFQASLGNLLRPCPKIKIAVCTSVVKLPWVHSPVPGRGEKKTLLQF